MSNSYFQFRQFRIEQDKCGMKVSTDACIQGAWTPLNEGPVRILDIGTGTGLLSLMLAQRNPLAVIDAVELDEAAATQATENIRHSAFAAQITVHHEDARTFSPGVQYNLVICNPPFFKDSLQSPDTARNQARHNLTLQQSDLVRLFDRHLKPGAYAAVLWPEEAHHHFVQLAGAHGWHVQRQLLFKDRAAATQSRVVGIFSRNDESVLSETLILKEADGSYTAAFRKLMRPFYLHI